MSNQQNQNQQQQTTVLPLMAPISIMPGPSPTEVGIERLPGPGGRDLVGIQFATRHGVFYFFLGLDAAKAIAKRLDEVSGAGIIIAPAGAV